VNGAAEKILFAIKAEKMMIQQRQLILVLLCAIAGFLILSERSAVLSLAQAGSFPRSFPGSFPSQAKQEQRGLSAEEKRGRAFYLRGESSSGQEVTAMVGEIDVPGSTLTCAGCHGARGEGKTEGGVTAGSLTWSYLTKPYGHVDDGKRKHQAFSENSFIRAMTAGVDPAGNKLSVAMPKYQMPQQDMANLIAYLKRIELDTDPGVTETSIVVGTLLPEEGALTGLAQSMGDVLKAYFAEVNSRSGIYNRKIELRVMHGDATSTVANMKHLIDDEHVFAIVSGLIAGADTSVAALSQEREVPFIGPSTLLPQRGLPLNRYVFYLLPGLKEQARTLVNFASKKTDPKKSRVGIICPDADFSRQIAASIEDQRKKLGGNPVAGIYYPHEGFNATQYVTELKRQGIDTVFLLGSGADAGALFKAAEAASWTPAIYLLGTLVGKDITEIVPVKMKDKVFLAFPTIPADVSAAGAAEYSALLEKYKLGAGHAAAQASAIAAAKILVHGLELAGKDLSRERLVTTLEGLYEFDTGLMPRITFGPNRRIGALGAYIVTIDPEKKLFPASAEWISAD
jgi:ABC-type branched-subunit amino acid transport system substrate-binding protein